MHNFFLISPTLGPEDRFTAHWCCLLSCYKDIGQAVVNQITASSGISSSQLLAIVDHPRGLVAERPDCLLRTEDFDILCEHKLNSPLGKNQLERYLSLVDSKQNYLALISNQGIEVPSSVLQSPHYLWPKEDRNRAHFLWRDMYPLVKQSRSVLGRQFKDYMDSLGMNPWSWGTFGDPFIEKQAADAFRKLYDPIVQQLKASGVTAIRRNNSLGLQIRYPIPEVPLLYVSPTQWDGSLDLPLTGRLLIMSTWVQGNGSTLPKEDGFIDQSDPPLFVNSLYDAAAKWRPGVFAERNYFVALDGILVQSFDKSSQNLARTILRAISHLADRRKTGLTKK